MIDQRRVLVVEDESQILMMWIAALQRLPWIDVEPARDGCQALERFRAAPFDLVVTDLLMPRMDGFELTKAIRSLDSRVPIVWVSAHAHLRKKMDDDGLRIHSFLAKPVSIQEIRRVVCDALDAHPQVSSAT
jgi:two-component system capsular synthesis sensor histidine kinase RcsC